MVQMYQLMAAFLSLCLKDVIELIVGILKLMSLLNSTCGWYTGSQSCLFIAVLFYIGAENKVKNKNNSIFVNDTSF